MKLVRDYENSAKKVASWKNHLRFNLHCKHHDIMPTSLRLASNIRGEKAYKIPKWAERALLRVRIGQTVRKLDNLTQKRGKLKQEVMTRLQRKQPEVEKFVEAAQVWKHMK